jgi:hypothetical protein
MLLMEPSLISIYHPSSGQSIGVKKTYPFLGRGNTNLIPNSYLGRVYITLTISGCDHYLLIEMR